jgi:RNA polymerase sigma factor (sigma-70 family)
MITESQKLLAEYVGNGSERAFRELVHRYLDLVYSAAIRLVEGDTHLAEDIAQTVFADLARAAHTLSTQVMLGGWLHRHTCFVTSKLMRERRRRESRERQAVEMNAQDHSKANLAEVAAILDEAINTLGAADRNAILLRFFEQRDLRSVGEALGTSEDTAQKRVARALAKLHSFLTRRGVSFSAGTLGTALATEAVTAAPAGLAATISTAALAYSATTGTTMSILKWMVGSKLQTGIVSAALVVGVATSLVIHHNSQAKMREQENSLQRRSDELAQRAAERERLVKLINQPGNTSPNNMNDLVRLRREVGLLRNQTNDLATLQNQNRRLQLSVPRTALQAREETKEKAIDKMNYAKGWIMAFRNYADENQDRLPTSFEQAARFWPDDVKIETDLRTDQFEIIYQGSVFTLTNPANVVVIREKQAWSPANPDNQSWARAYGFADGHSEIHIIRGVSNAVQAAEADRGRDAWEKAHMSVPQ